MAKKCNLLHVLSLLFTVDQDKKKVVLVMLRRGADAGGKFLLVAVPRDYCYTREEVAVAQK